MNSPFGWRPLPAHSAGSALFEGGPRPSSEGLKSKNGPQRKAAQTVSWKSSTHVGLTRFQPRAATSPQDLSDHQPGLVTKPSFQRGALRLVLVDTVTKSDADGTWQTGDTHLLHPTCQGPAGSPLHAFMTQNERARLGLTRPCLPQKGNQDLQCGTT